MSAELPAYRGKVLGQFLGDASFPVEWGSEDEKLQMWWYDDLHCPNPISPLWFLGPLLLLPVCEGAAFLRYPAPAMPAPEGAAP